MSSIEGAPPAAPATRPTPTPKERDRLRRFIRITDEMSRCRFICRCREQKHGVSCGPGDDGEPRLTAPEYDWEDFRSFLTVFRQVAYNKGDKDTVNLEVILGIVEKYASPYLRSKLVPIKEEIIPRLKGQYRGILLARHNESGDPEYSLTTHQMLDALMYGDVFHSDARCDERIDFLKTAERGQYLFIILAEIVFPTVRQCIKLFKAIRLDGILDDADYPAHCPRPRGPWPGRGE
jgi:hypothetical protein